MTRSRTNRWTFLFCLFLLEGCSTTSYRVLFQDDRVAELSVSPDRISLECEYISDADFEGLHAFYIYVLDKNNTVTTVFQSNTLDKDGCNSRLTKIGKILGEAERIYLAGRGDLNDTHVNKDMEYLFPGKGKFKSNGISLSFVAISNEKGRCYDAYGADKEKPCPSEPFPFWNRTQQTSP